MKPTMHLRMDGLVLQQFHEGIEGLEMGPDGISGRWIDVPRKAASIPSNFEADFMARVYMDWMT